MIVCLNSYLSESVIVVDGELYFKDVIVIDVVCEGYFLFLLSYFGRYIVFIVFGVMGDYVYVAISSAFYNGVMCGVMCVSCILCVYWVRKLFNNMSLVIEYVKLGMSGSLVRDAFVIEIVSDGGASGGTLYVFMS